ncbi:MAG TPA: ZIP family metal transporter [Nitrososphaeraceae archaeon]|jgi:zinc transporter, ZIP family|nr:ZIP family metal transporter [Nitrososphaeraceae archaeon]
MDYWQLLLLGSIAGFTIFLGLPLAVLQNLSPRKKGFLNAFAIGILVFLIIDVFSHAWESAEGAANDAIAGKSSLSNAIVSLLAMFGGLGIGLLGLTWYESRYMRRRPTQSHRMFFGAEEQGGGSGVVTTSSSSGDHNHHNERRQQQHLLQEVNAYKLAMMIAIGIGAHNFSEGLAIGQSYVSGAIALAILLIIGFGAHNATEGFGIAGPLTGLVNKPKVRFLILLGLIGGGPTFIGTIIGSLWTSNIASILFLSVAGGALIYVSMLMYNSGRKQTTNSILMIGIFVGLFAGFTTDLMIALAGA